ncbi:MAG: hypothetical protein QXU98_09700 [Candidatus Parvarchaeota archaeon]
MLWNGDGRLNLFGDWRLFTIGKVMMNIHSKVEAYLWFGAETVEGKRLTIKNPLIFFKRPGKIVLTGVNTFPFSVEDRNDMLKVVYFVVGQRISSGNDEGKWKFGKLPTASENGESGWHIETPSSLKYLIEKFDSTIMAETFLHDIHYCESVKDKQAVQAGGFTGDTILYYASKGATVWSFEPDPNSYNLALKNILLNRIYPKT